MWARHGPWHCGAGLVSLLWQEAAPYTLIQRRGVVSKKTEKAKRKAQTRTSYSNLKHDQLIYPCLTKHQDQQGKYNVTMKRVRMTTVAVKTQ